MSHQNNQGSPPNPNSQQAYGLVPFGSPYPLGVNNYFHHPSPAPSLPPSPYPSSSSISHYYSAPPAQHGWQPHTTAQRRPNVPSPAGPLGPPPVPHTSFVHTYRELLNQYLPRYTLDSSTSTSTAAYSNNHPAPSPPRFSLLDMDLTGKATRRFVTLLTQLRWMYGEIPAKVHVLWEDLEQALQNRYASEDWVEQIAIKVVQILNALFDGLWAGAQCNAVRPELKYSQRGDCNMVLKVGNIIAAVLAGEWKTSVVLDAHLTELLQPMVLSEGPEEDGPAIAKKLGLHISTAAIQHNLDVRYGIVFTGHSCVVAERLAVKIPGYLAIAGIALSDRVHLSGDDVDPIPIFAVLMGLLAPQNVFGAANNVSYGPVRDPSAEHALVGQWTTIQPQLLGLGLLQLDGTSGVGPSRWFPPLPPRGGGGYTSSPAAGGSKAGRSSDRGGSVYGGGSAYTSYRVDGGMPNIPSDLLLHFDLPGLCTAPRPLRTISREELQERSCLSPLSSVKSSTSPSPVASTPPSSPVSAGSCDRLLPRTVLDCPLNLYLESSVKSGEHAHVHRGQLRVDGTKISRVIFKSYDSGHFAELIRELDAYAALSRLAVIVPRLLAVVAPPTREYAALLLEDAGTPLGRGGWGDVDLTKIDKLRLYHALGEVHAAGIAHGDVFPRNIVRRLRGVLCLVDFGQANFHLCPGPTCGELSNLAKALGLE
ncbi:hypothetical protein B0H13DRAFT_2141030 [Mycena leptocephala]|nr:hypothetical protein B0H13DRAFT_2141030 [Mycena leptocephala]